MLEVVIRACSAVVGAVLVVGVFYWAMRILMVPSAPAPYGARMVFRMARNVMYLLNFFQRSGRQRREAWALYVPISLLAVIATTLGTTLIGYTLVYYGISRDSLHDSYVNSVSSLSVLGFGGEPSNLAQTTLAFAEAFTGPIMVALLITYLSTVNSSFNLRQHRLQEMDQQIGAIGNGPDLLLREASAGSVDTLVPVWKAWSSEFSNMEKNVDSVQGYLLLFAPSMHAHWITDALIVLDAANFRNNVLDQPVDVDATNCLVHGAAAMTSAVNTFHHHIITLQHNDAAPEVTQDQFHQACASLGAAGLALKPDLDAAWQAFSRQRSAYAVSVHKLAQMMDAPIVLW